MRCLCDLEDPGPERRVFVEVDQGLDPEHQSVPLSSTVWLMVSSIEL